MFWKNVGQMIGNASFDREAGGLKKTMTKHEKVDHQIGSEEGSDGKGGGTMQRSEVRGAEDKAGRSKAENSR